MGVAPAQARQERKEEGPLELGGGGGSVHLGLGAQRVSQLKRATLGPHEEAISSPPMLLPLLHCRRYCYRYYYIILIIITIVSGGHHTRLRSLLGTRVVRRIRETSEASARCHSLPHCAAL